MSDNRLLNGSVPAPGEPGELLDDELMNVAHRYAEFDHAVQLAIAAGSWPQTCQEVEQDPRLFRDLVGTSLIGIGLQRMTEAERDQALREAVERLHSVSEALGLPPDRFPALPQVIAATDRTPRRQVWEAALREPSGDGSFTKWPAPVQEHIIATALQEEDRFIRLCLEGYRDEAVEALPVWEWDPARLAAVRQRGDLQPAAAPEIDAYLHDARSEIRRTLGRTQVRAVVDWIDQQLQTLTDRGWTVDRVQNSEQADLVWSLHPVQRHLFLHSSPHAASQAALRGFSAEGVTAYAMLTAALADVIARTAPSQAPTAYPGTMPDHAIAPGSEPAAAPAALEERLGR